MKNNDNWLNSIREKMDGFEFEEPDGLWEKIEDRHNSSLSKRNRPYITRWMWTAAASVAAVIAIIFSLTSEHNDITRQIPDECRMLTQQKHSSEEESATLTNRIINTTTQEKHTTEKLDIEPAIENMPENSKPVTTGTLASQDKTSPAPASPREPYYTKKPGRAITSIRKHSTKHNVAIGMFASGTVNNTSAGFTRINQYSPLRSLFSLDEYTAPSTLLQAASANALDIKNISLQHKQPIRAGLSISYYITSRIGIESGISYSFLSSDIKDNAYNSHISGEQKLHYIGIPVNLKLHIAKWRALRIYASAGVLGEKLISGKLSGHITDENNLNAKKTISLHEKQLQWSVNAAAGMQFDITDALGVYAEPGVSCYFDNGSDTRNIYKDRPINFNLNVGLRINLRK